MVNKLTIAAGLIAGLAALALLTKKASATPTPANITVSTVLDKTVCSGACTVNGTVTYTNTGGAARTITPTVAINGVNTPIAAAQTLQPGDVINVTFSQAITAQTTFCGVVV